MFNNVVIREDLPEDIFSGETFINLKSKFVNDISENKLTISQTRYLFNSILNQFEREMPVTNHIK